jgi:AbiV family abortive infection protein
MTEMTPAAAREFWKALMDNASSLIADARLLLTVESYGRARSLTVLAQEELGKALWVYQTFQQAWSVGDDQPRKANALGQHGRNHTRKYLEAIVFGNELASFWGHDSDLALPNEGESWEDFWARRNREAGEAATEANLAKQRGFYVDRDDEGHVFSPTGIPSGTIAEDLAEAAQVVEMLLIQDHSRMKFEASTPYDSTHEQQFRLLPISHPDDWAAASDGFKGQSAPPES